MKETPANFIKLNLKNPTPQEKVFEKVNTIYPTTQ